MKINISHPTGSQFVRALIKTFFEADVLEKYYTTIAFNPLNKILNLLPDSMFIEVMRRSYNIPSERIETQAFRELIRLIAPKLGLNQLTKDTNAYASVDNVYKSFDNYVARKLINESRVGEIDAIYAFEDGALETFKQAKLLGIKCIYDLPIAYWETLRSLLLEEAIRLPSWARTLEGGITDNQMKLDRKVEEMELADIVVSPSKFVLDTLPTWVRNKPLINSPFGTPFSNTYKSKYESDKAIDTKRPLRVLFAGSMSQRKGLGDLFTAMKELRRTDVQLIVLGSLFAPIDFYRGEYPDFIYKPGRPHHQVLELMQSCDVFCLPSIVEGRALVMQEAMSQELPLIITPNTGGEDLIIEGQTGFLIPIRSPLQIADKINWFADNRSALPVMGQNARKKALEYSWDGYGNQILKSINTFLR